MRTEFYQNRRGFAEDMTKTFWCVFPVHSVDSEYGHKYFNNNNDANIAYDLLPYNKSSATTTIESANDVIVILCAI